jgi:uncharacterized protein (TIGR02722 family)
LNNILENILKKIMAISLCAIALSGCETVSPVMSSNPNANRSSTGAPGIQTLSLSRVDFELAAKEVVQQFLKSKYAQKPGGGTWTAIMGEVVNDTSLRINTQDITDRMQELMIESGNFQFSQAAGTERSAFVADSRQLNKSALFDKNTTARNGTVKAPDLQMAGVVRQSTVTSADKKQQEIQYTVSFKVVEATTGIVAFQKSVPIDKRGSNANFIW